MIKKIYKSISIACITILMGFTLTASPVFSQTGQDDIANFTVEAVIPENQIDKTQTYFDLLMKPEQKQTIQVRVTNTSDEAIIVTAKTNAATTGLNGTIVYSVPGVKDKSLKNSIEDIASMKAESIELEPKASEMVDIDLTMPKKEFDGVVLGGIMFTSDKKNKQEEPTKDEGISLQNKIAFVLGIKLTETDKKIEPNMNLKDIKAEVVALKTAVVVNLQNDQAVIMKNVAIDAKIYKKNEKEVLHSSSTKTAEIAPNSNFDYSIDWGNNKVEPGEYRLKMRVDYGEDFWEWDQEFKINDDNSTEVNENAINVKDSFPMWIFIPIGILAVSLIFLLAFLLGKRSKNKSIEK